MVVRLFKYERRSSEFARCATARSAFFRYAATLALTVSATIAGGSALWDAIIAAPMQPIMETENSVPRTASAVLETADDWMQSVRSEKFWARKSGSTGGSPSVAKPDYGQRSGLMRTSIPPSAAPKVASLPTKTAPPKSERTDGADWYTGDGGNYRTICVRLCDGYFWPISFSTVGDNFDRDKRVCEKSCGGSQTRLFVHENPGQDIEQMVDLKGAPYTKLRTAFLFRTTYEQSCKCNAHPWEQASKDRHRVYALEAEKRKGSQHAAAELMRMKLALVEARKTAAVVRTASIETARSGAPVSAMKRLETPVPVVIAGHTPMSAMLNGPVVTALGAAPSFPASASPLTRPVADATTNPNRLQQWAQMTTQTLPPVVASKVVSDQSNVLIPQVGGQLTAPLPSATHAKSSASSSPATILPAAPFKLANTAPWVGATPPAFSGPKLAVVAPPIVASANDELGLKAPVPVNTAQLEQVNPPRKPSRVVEPKSEPKTERKVAALTPSEPKPRRSEPREEPSGVSRREPEPQPVPRQERRSTPAPREVERPAPRPVLRVVEAPRPAPPVARARPQQVNVARNDNWRVKVFESR